MVWTNLYIPSSSLIKKFVIELNSEVLQQTGEHENAAKKCYFSIFSSSHENLKLSFPFGEDF